MLEAALVVLRFLQFLGAAVLFGAPLFWLYGMKAAQPVARRLVALAALALALAAALSLHLQVGTMAGALAADPALLAEVVVTMPFGRAFAVRILAGALAVALCTAMSPGRWLWVMLSLLGAAALLSFPWTGHGAATEGSRGVWHLLADALHLLAAGVWIGALFAMHAALGAARRGHPGALQAAHAALAGFAGVGSFTVAMIVATGLANTWFLVGPEGVARLATSAWGMLLLVKLALFAGMLALAAANRFRHTPALAAALDTDPEPALRALRRSVGLETALGAAVLALVAALGRLAPPIAG